MSRFVIEDHPDGFLAIVDEIFRSLSIESTEVRGSDDLDFHEVGVAGLRRALNEAYKAGVRDGRRAEVE